MPRTSTSRAPGTYDLFLSYNHADVDAVDCLREQLVARGIRAFQDHVALDPGMPWPEALERALQSARGVAVLLGPRGLGGWQRRELFFALDLQVAAQKEGRRFPVIPVLLEGADLAPSFLLLNTWIDLRHSVASAAAAIASCLDHASIDSMQIDPRTVHPYMGLRAFREEDSAFFFGRASFIEALVDRFARYRVVAVVGASGSGKSSVVRAGLVPYLRKQRPPRPTWEIAAFTPGRYPWMRMANALISLLEPEASESELSVRVVELARVLQTGPAAISSTVERALRASGGADRLLLIIDQLEEVFTLTVDAEQRPFIEHVLSATSSGPLHVVLTLRGDFYGRALESSRPLSDVLGSASVSLGTLDPRELREIVEQPALKVGATFEPGLVETIVEAVHQQPGHLPLLEYALTELWNSCVNASRSGEPVELTLEAYRSSGKIESAIGTRAQTLFESLSAPDQDTARHLFGNLVRVARGGDQNADTRRRATRSELGTAAWDIAMRFAAEGYRLLVMGTTLETNDPTVEIAHEALIQNWPALRRWIDADRAALATAQHVADAAAEWDRHNQSSELLLRGSLLAAARLWALPRLSTLPTLAREFVIRSVVWHGAELEVWIPEYSRAADPVALARDLLNTPEWRRGVDVLRWSPPDSTADEMLATVATSGVGRRRAAVEALCARGGVHLLREALHRSSGRQRELVYRALGHARNVPGTGVKAFTGLTSRQRIRASWSSLFDLLTVYRAAFALCFALSSLLYAVASEAIFRLVVMIQQLASATELGVFSPFSQTSFTITAGLGLMALVRARIDQRPASDWYMFAAGALAGVVAEGIQIVGRLAEEAVQRALPWVSGSSRPMTNLLFAFTDPLDVIIAMGVVAIGLRSAARMAPRRSFSWRFCVVAFIASHIAVLVGRVTLPLTFNLIGLNFSFEPVERVVLQGLLAVVTGLVAGTGGLIGFRLGLRVAFEERPYPEWDAAQSTSHVGDVIDTRRAAV